MAAREYHSNDFQWDELRIAVEADYSLAYHIEPFTESAQSQSQSNVVDDAEAWRAFHRRHSAGNFFKERRYLLKEFPELALCHCDSVKLLEIGCGNGSTVLPILRSNQDILVYACDCSEETLLKAKEIVAAKIGSSIEHRFQTIVLDITNSSFPEWLFCTSCQKTSVSNPVSFHSELKNCCCNGGVDFVTLIFSLSAIPFRKMLSVIKECYSVMKPGSLLFFRDYGLYDMTMLRFLPKQRVGFREYMRLDGTYSYFFSLDVVRDLFLGAGFTELELDYCCVSSVNRRSGKKMQRVWVHGKFQKKT